MENQMHDMHKKLVFLMKNQMGIYDEMHYHMYIQMRYQINTIHIAVHRFAAKLLDTIQ